MIDKGFPIIKKHSYKYIHKIITVVTKITSKQSRKSLRRSVKLLQVFPYKDNNLSQ